MSSFSLSYEDYPGHVTFPLIPGASAVLQLHGYHVRVSEGNRNSATLLRRVGADTAQKCLQSPLGEGYALACDPKSQPAGRSLGKKLPREFLLKKPNVICSPLLSGHHFTPELKS